MKKTLVALFAIMTLSYTHGMAYPISPLAEYVTGFTFYGMETEGLKSLAIDAKNSGEYKKFIPAVKWSGEEDIVINILNLPPIKALSLKKLIDEHFMLMQTLYSV